MAFVTSRGFELPESAEDMGDVWFSLWRSRLWPYSHLNAGDELYWYETPSKRIVWRSRVERVSAFQYRSLSAALSRVDEEFQVEIDRDQAYLGDKPNEGYCLAYRVGALERLDLPKPTNVRFSQQGWERSDRTGIAAWLAQAPPRGGAERPRNPDWARDEIVLTLDLFVRSGATAGGALPGKTDPSVIALSERLGRLPIHPRENRSTGFRNPTGVSLKLANFRAIARALAVERGESHASEMPRGMGRYSALDRSIFEEFDGDWERLHAEALAITAEAGPASDTARPAVVTGPIEATWAETFTAAPSAGGLRSRREATLVHRYATWMSDHGIDVARQQYAVEGETRPLVCDVLVPELSLLVEAKGQDDRNSIRLAIGQLMDYRRFADVSHLAVLLPHEPAADHRSLLGTVDIAWIWPDRRGHFRDSAAGRLVGR